MKTVRDACHLQPNALSIKLSDQQVDDLIRHRLRDMFKPVRKTCYEEVLPLPKLSVGEIPVEGPFIEALLTKVLEKFAPDTPVTMTFRKAHFQSGHDLKDFAGKLGIELKAGDVEQ